MSAVSGQWSVVSHETARPLKLVIPSEPSRKDTAFGPRTVPAVSPRRAGALGPNGVSFREDTAARRPTGMLREGETAGTVHPFRPFAPQAGARRAPARTGCAEAA